jgi:hypothetical protein
LENHLKMPAAVLLTASLFLSVPAATLADTSTSGAEPKVIQLDLFQGKQFTVDAIVGGVKRTFLFDTGEGVTMISPNVARDIGCQPWGNITGFRMTGERMDVPRCDNVEFDFSGRRYTAPTSMVFDLGKIDPATAKLDGAVGLDLFAGKTITIQFASRKVVLETDQSAAERVRQGIEVPIRLSRPSEGAALDVNIGVETSHGRAWMELDSGNAGPTIFVSPQVAPLLGLRADTREPQAITARFAPGVSLVGKARVFPNMIMDGNIGMQLMGKRDITLDLLAGRAWVGK